MRNPSRRSSIILILNLQCFHTISSASPVSYCSSSYLEPGKRNKTRNHEKLQKLEFCSGNCSHPLKRFTKYQKQLQCLHPTTLLNTNQQTQISKKKNTEESLKYNPLEKTINPWKVKIIPQMIKIYPYPVNQKKITTFRILMKFRRQQNGGTTPQILYMSKYFDKDNFEYFEGVPPSHTGPELKKYSKIILNAKSLPLTHKSKKLKKNQFFSSFLKK